MNLLEYKQFAIETAKQAGEELASKFGINDGEIEDIFDVLAKEHPEL